MESLLVIPFVLLVCAAVWLCDRWAGHTDGTPAQESGVRDQDGRELKGQPQTKSLKQYLRGFGQGDNALMIAGIVLFLTIVFYFSIAIYIEKSIDDYLIYNSNLSFPLVDLKKPFLLKYSSVFVNIGLALLYGFLLYNFIKFIKKYDGVSVQPSKLAVMLWIVALVLVPAIGLFKSEAKTLMASIKRLETPAGAIEFEKPSDGSNVSLYFDSKAPTQNKTNFQAGVQSLKETLDSIQSDFKKVIKFCRTDRGDGPFCAPHLGKSDEKEARTEREKLLSAMAVTYGYARKIEPIAICLNAYACFYENGVPIQDDLSEIAASYATPPSIPLGCPTDGKKKDAMCEPVDRIRDHLEVFRNQDWSDAPKDKCAYLAPCLDKENRLPLPTAEDVISHRDAVLATGKAVNASVTGKPREIGFILPYRSMLSSALLTASGYPAEAVGHMERGYRRLVHKFDRKFGAQSESPPADFVESVLRLRQLNALQEAGEHSRNHSLKLKYQGMERDLALVHLNSNLKVNGFQREDLLEDCVPEASKNSKAAGIPGNSDAAPRFGGDDPHERFVSLLTGFTKSQEIKMEAMADRVEFSSEKLGKDYTDMENRKYRVEETRLKLEKMRIRNESFEHIRQSIENDDESYKESWTNYKRNFIFYFVNADFRRMYSIARQHDLDISGENLRESQEWWKVATEKAFLVDRCFSTYPDEYIEYLRFHMAYAFGLLHAEKAQRLSKAAALIRSGFTDSGSIPVDMYEVNGIACMAYTGLRRAYNIGQGLALKKTDLAKAMSDAIAEEMHEAPSMLRHLAGYLASTGSDCLN